MDGIGKVIGKGKWTGSAEMDGEGLIFKWTTQVH